MPDYSLTLPSWSVGENALDKIREILPSGQIAVVIGGKKGTAAIRSRLAQAAQGHTRLLDFLWYGGEASEENIAALAEQKAVRDADVIFAVGGGKALDTCKTLGFQIGKPVYAFPTIASTCAACTAVSILYHPDGSFAGPRFLPAPPVHCFIYTPVIASAPPRYLLAGMGDTYAKYFESTMSARGDDLAPYHDLGVGVSRMCLDPILRHGGQAMADHRAGRNMDALEQVILAVIVNTAIASILLTTEALVADKPEPPAPVAAPNPDMGMY
jgi:glycerol dehydrogenase